MTQWLHTEYHIIETWQLLRVNFTKNTPFALLMPIQVEATRLEYQNRHSFTMTCFFKSVGLTRLLYSRIITTSEKILVTVWAWAYWAGRDEKKAQNAALRVGVKEKTVKYQLLTKGNAKRPDDLITRICTWPTIFWSLWSYPYFTATQHNNSLRPSKPETTILVN